MRTNVGPYAALKSRFRRIGFQQKLLASMLLCVYLPLLFTAFLSVNFARARLVRDTQQLFVERLHQARAAVDDKLSEMKSVYATVNIQGWMFDILRSEDIVTESYEYIDSYHDMSWFLFSLRDGLGIDDISLYFRRPNAYVDGVSFFPLGVLEEALGPAVTTVGGRVAAWIGPSARFDSVSFVGPILQEGPEFVFEGRVWVRVDADYFRSALGDISSSVPYIARIRDAEGNRILQYVSSGLEPEYSGLEPDALAFPHHIRLVEELPTNRWKLEAFVPRAFLSGEAFRESSTLLAALALITIAIGPPLFLIARSLAIRIAKLRRAMDQSDGEPTALLTRIPDASVVDDGDEIDGLIRSYNGMAHRIETLVDTLYRAELEGARHHLSALQSQINPHFLYNTLDAIRCNVSLDEQQRADEIIRALSRLLRIALSGGQELISVERELELVSLYLELNAKVYGERYTYEVDNPEWTNLFAVPRFVLQPLVENAISHGLHNVAHDGSVRVTVCRRDCAITISVVDNGVGMTDEELEAVRATLGSEIRFSESIGLSNVDQRLKLAFGDAYGIDLARNESGGTTAMIRIPEVRRENSDT